MKHLFEQVSTSSPAGDIVQVFDEHVYDSTKENLMSAMVSAARTASPVFGDPRPGFGLDSHSAAVLSLDSAPSARRRREALRRDEPSSLRRPVVPASRGVRAGARLVQLLGGALATLALGAAGAGAGLMLSPGTYSGPTAVHAVSSGESLWSIAQGVNTDRPLEEVVTDIEALNGIEGGLVVGDLIEVPIR